MTTDYSNNTKAKAILGIWDGHDSGAVLLTEDKILGAVNEERFTRRKLEIKFPKNSIAWLLKNNNEIEIESIWISTSDPSKTIARVFPSTKEKYYQIRRRINKANKIDQYTKSAKYFVTELEPNCLSKFFSKIALTNNLKELGLDPDKLNFCDHHLSHAYSAAFGSGYTSCAVVTLDGLGDGLSGSVSKFTAGKLEVVSKIDCKNSLGIFFEHVTNLLNFRELEDEGKVMALANYSIDIPDNKNPLLDFFRVDNLQIHCKFHGIRLYQQLKKVFWHYPFEQFAFLAQRVHEIVTVELIKNVISTLKQRNLAVAGGVFANVKTNMLIREISGVESFYVFPHMGDGGLAFGSACIGISERFKARTMPLNTPLIGPSYGSKEIKLALKESNLQNITLLSSISDTASELLCKNQIIMWHQNGMEYGPRALGGRSIIARPDSLELKDEINLRLKKRVWYQPFCPSMLRSYATKALDKYQGELNEFMTIAYRTKKNFRNELLGVINIDGSCRPQILSDTEDTEYRKTITKLGEKIGIGCILNTSFNFHGEPLVCTPRDSIRAFKDSAVNYLIIGDYLVQK